MTPQEAADAICRDLAGLPMSLKVIADQQFPARVTVELRGTFDVIADGRERIAAMKRGGRLGTLTVERYPTEIADMVSGRDVFEISNVVTGAPGTVNP